jgi:ABC-type transport system involved in multi-copper enzyme maturation permease subunit
MSSLRTIGTVAQSVFRESVRDKVLYNLVAFAVLLMAASYLIGQLTAGQDIKIIKDLGLAAIATFGLMIAVFIGIGLVWKEVERRSIYSLLSKPLSRAEFILGKYCGLGLTLAVNVVVMVAAWYVVLAYMATTVSPEVRAGWPAPATDLGMLRAVGLILVELMLVTAIALFFSTFSSPFLSAGLTLGLWVIGHFNADLKNFESVIEAKPLVWLARTIYYALPNLAAFDIKSEVVHGQPITWGFLGFSIAYATVYASAVLTLATLIFSRRDFK